MIVAGVVLDFFQSGGDDVQFVELLLGAGGGDLELIELLFLEAAAERARLVSRKRAGRGNVLREVQVGEFAQFLELRNSRLIIPKARLPALDRFREPFTTPTDGRSNHGRKGECRNSHGKTS